MKEGDIVAFKVIQEGVWLTGRIVEDDEEICIIPFGLNNNTPFLEAEWSKIVVLER